MIKVTHGIEGDDIPYHLRLLGFDINAISDRYYFFPLNDHYGQHPANWLDTATASALDAEVVVFYDLVNTGDYEHDKFCKFVTEFDHPCKVYLTVNQSSRFEIPGVKIVRWDFMWNRIKAYYTECIPGNLLLHHYSGLGHYSLPRLYSGAVKNKLFLSLCGRDYGYRTRLFNDVSFNTSGYCSNRSRGIYLEDTEVVGAFNPVPHKFYTDSYFSVYVESNVSKPDLIHVTEKTFEPLIKGHFILPVANPGTVQRIRDLGFKLPEFIDYSYDTELDPDIRYSKVIKEFNRLLTLDWQKLYQDNFKELEFNQTCIDVIPYDRRILEVFDV